jgi:DNA polymerase III subunit gamma/tau
LLDQAIAFCGGAELKRAQVEDMLGTQGRQILFEILRAVGAGKGDALLACVEKLDAQAPDYSSLLNDLAAILQRVAVLQVLPAAADADDDPAAADLGKVLAAEDVQVYYQIVVNGRRDLPWVPDPRQGFEMTLLRMLAFRPGGAAPKPVGAAHSTSSGQASAATKVGGNPVAAKAAPATSAPIAGAAHSTSSGQASTATITEWAQRIESLGLDGFTKQLARNCEWRGQDGDTVKLALDPAARHLLKDDRRAAIEQALARQLGGAVKLAIEPGQAGANTPVRLDEQREAERQRAAEQAIEADPAVRAMKEKFGATVRAGSVQPTTGSNGANK